MSRAFSIEPIHSQSQDAGELPDYLEHAWDNARTHALGERGRRTQLVNEARGVYGCVYYRLRASLNTV